MLLPPDSPHPGRSTLERGILSLSTPKQARRTLAQRGQSANPQPSSLKSRHWALTVIPFCSHSIPGQVLKRPIAKANVSALFDPLQASSTAKPARKRGRALWKPPLGSSLLRLPVLMGSRAHGIEASSSEPAGRASIKVVARRALQAFTQGDRAYRQSLPGQPQPFTPPPA